MKRCTGLAELLCARGAAWIGGLRPARAARLIRPGRFERIAAIVAALAVGAIGAPPALAAFVKIDDFQELAVGQPVNGQGKWQAEAGNLFEPAGVAVDPVDPQNLVLRIGQGNYSGGRLGHRETINTVPGLVIHNGTTATLFFRLRYGDQQMDFSVGMTDVANPISDVIFNSFTQFESQLALSFTPGSDLLRIRDGATLRTLTDQVAKDTWYNLWLVIDNHADTTRIYIQGGAFAEQTLLSVGDQEEFRFRNSGGATQDNDLVTFFIATGRNTSNQPPSPTEHNGPAFIDDIYLDASGVNLANPVPEPSTLALTAIGSAALAIGKRLARRRNK